MGYGNILVRSFRVEGKELGQATLALRRDDPEPDIRGLKSWGFSGETDQVGPMAEDAEVSATLPDGREVKGRAFLTTQHIQAGRGLSTSYVYKGTGPLEGTTEEDYD